MSDPGVDTPRRADAEVLAPAAAVAAHLSAAQRADQAPSRRWPSSGMTLVTAGLGADRRRQQDGRPDRGADLDHPVGRCCWRSASVPWCGARRWWACSPTPRCCVALQVAAGRLAIGWGLLFIDAWRLARPPELARRHRLGFAALSGVLVLAVVGGLVASATIVSSQRDLMTTGLRRRRRDQGPARPLQHPAARRGRREGPGRASTRQPHGGQRGRRDRSYGADQPAAQHGGRPFPAGSPMRGEVPQGVRLQGPLLHAERGLHVRHHAQGPVSRQRQGSWGPGHQGGGRGSDRAQDQLLRDGRPQGLRGTGRRGRRDPDRRQPTASRSAAASPSCTATSRRARTSCWTDDRRCGSPARGRTRPTTTGWLGRSA